jgi:hypothetical protein
MVDEVTGGSMKRRNMLAAGGWGIVMGLWLVTLIALVTTVVLFFGGLIIPNVTVGTIIEGWWWTAMVVTLGVIGWAVSRRKLARLLDRSFVRVYAWSTLFGVSLIVLFYAVERWRGHHAWQKLEIELGGAPLELRGLKPFPVAEEQNFAALPLVEEWWRESVARSDEIRLQRLARRVPGEAGGAWELHRPVDLAACLDHYLPSARASDSREEFSAAQFLAAWREFEPEMDQLSAGAERPHARFELPYDRGMFDDTLGRKLELFRAVGQAYRLRAVAALRVQATGRALSDVEVLCRISELIGQEPLLERQRLSLLLASLQPVWEGITRGQWSEAQLATLQGLMARPDLLGEHGKAVHKEFALMVDLVEKLFPARSTVPAVDVADESAGRMLIKGLRVFYPTGWLFQNQVGLYRLSGAIREGTVAAAEHRVFVDVTRQIGRSWAHRPPSLDPFFATFVMPRGREVVQDAAERYAHAQTALDLAATACALERYRLARRELPESLALLAPDWIVRIPTDVIDGRPLRYRRLDRGRYLLYSVGWNQTDEGGQVAERTGPDRPWEESLQIRAEGDWVWGWERGGLNGSAGRPAPGRDPAVRVPDIR